MDEVVNRFARELADAIASAVAGNPQVEECRERARAAGFEMKVTLEAVVGFANRAPSQALTRVVAPARQAPPRRGFEVTTNAVTFLDDAGAESTPVLPKSEIAGRILDRLEALLAAAPPTVAR